MIGSSIAHYRITDKLGVGGMGEVYRATDSRLNRDVAVKVLPDSLAGDSDRLARFQREAQVLAALNHSNIAQIYGLENHEGRQAIILELVEGETLAERIDRGPLPVEEARSVALQISEALEVAHEKGIIHRDLKPANIKITPDGTVKVLDFGLAKALAPETPDADMSLSPTMTAAATQAGVIMGTAAYMSPEQARGKPVDRRADIWAFGCVLYEMLVASKPFKGTDVSEMMAHIITKEPDLTSLPSGLPARVKDLIQRCMRKDVRMRLPDIGAARIALQEVSDAPDEPTQTPGATATSSSRMPLAVAATVAGVVVGLLLGWGFLAGPSAPPPSTATHFELVLDPPPVHWAMAFSSDGGSVVYSGRRDGGRQLYVRDLNSYTSRSLAGTEGGHWPVLSPDGTKVAFFSAGRLKTINLEGGGLPEPVCGVAGNIGSAVWTPDNHVIWSTNVTIVPQQVDMEGGEPEPVRIDDLEEGAKVVTPRLLPGGTALLATLDAPSLDGTRIVVIDRETGNMKILVRGQDARYIEPASLVFIQKDRLMVTPFDLQTHEITGPERKANLEDPAIVPTSSDESYSAFHSAVAANRTFLYIAGRYGKDRSLYWLDREGNTEATEHKGELPRLDSTGRYATINIAGYLNRLDLQEGVMNQLTFDGNIGYAIWSHDDQEIIFGYRTFGGYVIHSTSSDGQGEMKRLVPESALEKIPSPVPNSVFPDGRILIYGIHPETNRDLWILHPDGKTEPLLVTRANERGATISHDGSLLAYVSDEEGSDEIYVRELPDSGRRWRASPEGGLSPVWSRDGQELFFRSGDTIMVTSVSNNGSVRIGEPAPVFTSHRLELDLWGNKTFDTAPDGRLLISMIEPDDVRVRIVLDWDPRR